MRDYHRRSHEDYAGEPVIIERSPQLYNLFRSRKKRVHIIEEVPIRSRRQERRSPTPPAFPRGPFHTMAPDPEDEIYTPLPPKLPLKARKYRDDDEPRRYDEEERSPQRYRKVKVAHGSWNDEDAHPRVVSPSPPRRRDSGKYHVTGARVDGVIENIRPQYELQRSDPQVERLRADIDRLRRERREAELAALAAKNTAERLKADLEYEKRERSLEKRKRLIAEREKRLSQEQDQVVQVRRPHERQHVVVVHNPPATVQTHEPSRSAQDRARDDYQRGQPIMEDRRPGTGDRRARRQSIIIVGGDEHACNQDRDRGHQRR